jgi:hypothetical protein
MKFLNCAQRTLPTGSSHALLATLRGIEGINDIRGLTNKMTPQDRVAAE